MISKYFKNVESILEENNHIIEDYIVNKQTFTHEKGAIEGEVFFIDNSQLDFNEVVNSNMNSKTKYSYHYMDSNKALIFRYDNVPHHRAIPSFPHHKHTPLRIVESKEPNLETVLSEIEQKLINNI